ncbi:MAG: NAD(P)H-hydrate dehydratase, partial [Actinomycetota bacterium]
PEEVPRGLGVSEAADVAAVWPARSEESHKRSSGVVLVIAGSRDMTGAPRLVARAAARVGAGLVQVAAPTSALPAIQAGLVGATFLALPETEDGTLAPGAIEALKEHLEGADAVAIGPGLGRHPDTDGTVRDLVQAHTVPTVVDADALNAFEGRVGALITNRSGIVLTPHAGEASRLLGVPAGQIDADRVGSVRALANHAEAVALLKGRRTAIAEPAGKTRINETGTPVLATGGTGDVLTGVIAGLLARGTSSLDAASAGAFVHGIAGGLAGEELGEGTTAEDLVELLPAAVEEVLAPW